MSDTDVRRAAPSATPFARRHIGPTQDEKTQMLAMLGYQDVESFLSALAPDGIRANDELDIQAAVSEAAVIAELRALADQNQVMTSMIGMGYYDTAVPAVIKRNVLENPGWYTSYTPYQAEISQGRLEALLNFQTVCTELTGLDIAGSSLLDESTAVAEAMALMRRASKVAKDAVLLVDEHLFPQSLSLLQTRAAPNGWEVISTDLTSISDESSLSEAAGGRAVFGAVVQYPGADGEIRDWRTLAEVVHAQGGLVTAAADILALALLTPPAEWGADIAVGNSQRLGVPMGFGGPHAGYMAVRSGLERTMPGRLVGVSVDADGNPGYRLALQTREQHIRREKATSNICTAQALLAVMASMYVVYHGPEGLREIARGVSAHASALAKALQAAGAEVTTQRYFDTLTVSVPGRADDIVAAALAKGINIWKHDGDTVRISCDEKTSAEHLRALVEAFGGSAEAVTVEDFAGFGEGFDREGDFLDHPTFHSYHNETAMMRYLRLLMDRDYALDRGMIPLGSCTMKLNAVTEMEAITWPEFGGIHPFAPADQWAGYQAMIDQLCGWLCEVTGYDAVSIQPNAGSQGEFAGLMAIRAFHAANGEEGRTVCLIPASAHGTNAASAAMAGFSVVVVKNLPNGNIDMDDLAAKVEKHRDQLGAIMVTYPSTYGVFEDTIQPLCAMIHEAGGQVYVDGANLNAQMGIARPGHYGADVSHLNLHKTFAIPHGGGGPGVGPVAVREHLAPYLPNHPLVAQAGPDTSYGPVSGAPFGSASVLPISWAYIRLMGGQGLKDSSVMAVLNANYIARRLGEYYPVMFTGNDNLVGHECILDLRKITHDTGVTVDDVAKRLIDYGFHAPTMSFPVAGTLMVEPTESEDKNEIDRFCDAMISIHAEIMATQEDGASVEDSALRHAPHTAASLVGEWNHSYDRATAVYPGGVDPLKKYWPPVRRIDGAHGDRNLICTCPPPEAFESDPATDGPEMEVQADTAPTA